MLSKTAVGAALLTAFLAATVPTGGAAVAAGGTLDGLSTTDFAFVDGPQGAQLPASQVTISQTAAAASTHEMSVNNTLGEQLLSNTVTNDKQFAGRNAYGHGAGVSAQFGAPPGDTPLIAETRAEAVSPPAQTTSSSLVDVPAAPLATASVLPSTATARTHDNTGSPTDFCPTIGGPISNATTNVAQAAVLPADSVATGFALASLDSAVRNSSTQFLAPNGETDAFGLDSESTLNTTGITLFKNVPGASIDVRVLAPVTLRAFAAGIAGKSKASFGVDGGVPLVQITAGGGTQTLTLNDLLGGGATIDLDGLLKVTIALTPTTTVTPDGTRVTSAADLVHVQVVGATSPSQGTVGGPLGSVLNPVLAPVFSTLDQTGIFQQIDDALKSAGLTQGANIYLGHFESRAQVPAGGVICKLPVKKSADHAHVVAGDGFTYTITVRNPFSCPLSPVRVVDEITADDGVRWSVTGTTPKASSVSDSRVVWDTIGSIAPGASRSVSIHVTVSPDSAAGVFTDNVTATGKCTGDATTNNTAYVLTGNDTIVTPHVTTKTVSSATLPHTGGSDRAPLLALATLVLAGALQAQRSLRRG